MASPQLIDEYGYPTRPDTRRRWRNLLVHFSKGLLSGSISVVMHMLGIWLWVRQLARRREILHPSTFRPQHILVLRMDLIGDLVLSLTVVRMLKRTYPDAEIDLLALPSSAAVVEHDPDLAQVIPYDPNIWRRPRALFVKDNWRALSALRRRFRERSYDLAISVSGPWAALLAALSGAPRRVGFGRESYPNLVTDSVAGAHWMPDDHLHEVDYCLKLAEAAGATIESDDRVPRLYVPITIGQQIEDMLQQAEIQLDVPIIACHVSSNNGQSKRWPVPYWSRLIDHMAHKDGYIVIITGAPGDLPVIERILQRIKDHAGIYNFAGKTSLAQLAALLQRAHLLITGDSGPMHIAAAVGTSLIAIHGPTDPVMSGPVSPSATVLRSDIWCSPCYTARGGPADCRFFTTQCMKDITPEQVQVLIDQKLQEQQGHHQQISTR